MFPQLAIVFALGSLLLTPTHVVESRATSTVQPPSEGSYSQTLPSLSPLQQTSPTGDDTYQTPQNASLHETGSTIEQAEEGEDELENAVDGSRHQTRRSRHIRLLKCSPHSKSSRCQKRKHHKVSTKQTFDAIAFAAQRAVSLTSKDILRSGDATYYGTGLGACGITSSDTSMIAAASQHLFDNWPGAGANPNNNPICGRKVEATYKGQSVVVEIVDRCVACAMFDLDFSPKAFGEIGPMDKGRLHGMTWRFL